MSRKNLRRSGITETSAVSIENVDSVCSQRQVSDVYETTGLIDQTVIKSENNENFIMVQNEETCNEQLSSSLPGNIPKVIPTNEADMLCTTIENVSHVRFEWTVEDFYPQM